MYRVHLDRFEGPLDLLLFFIRRDELDVFDIPIARITDEFLAYVRVLEELDLDSAADFIFMAALLIQIKARMLLPRPELDADGEPIDPRRELVERLLEYMRYKEAAGHLEHQLDRRQALFTRGKAADEQARLSSSAEVVYRASLFDLVSVLRRVLAEAPEEVLRHPLARYAYTIEEQQAWVMQRLGEGPAPFVRLVRGQARSFIIVTFLAVLELLRSQNVRLVGGHSPEDFAIEVVAPLPAPAVEAPPSDAVVAQEEAVSHA